MEDIYEKISNIMTWYQEYSAVTFPDELLAKRDELAILSYRLAEKTGDAGQEKDNSNFIRIMNIARHQDVLMEKDVAFNKSEVKSLLENEVYYRDAIQKKIISDKNNILLKQITVVIGCMNQRIAYAIKEKHNSEYTHRPIFRK